MTWSGRKVKSSSSFYKGQTDWLPQMITLILLSHIFQARMNIFLVSFFLQWPSSTHLPPFLLSVFSPCCLTHLPTSHPFPKESFAWKMCLLIMVLSWKGGAGNESSLSSISLLGVGVPGGKSRHPYVSAHAPFLPSLQSSPLRALTWACDLRMKNLQLLSSSSCTAGSQWQFWEVCINPFILCAVS